MRAGRRHDGGVSRVLAYPLRIVAGRMVTVEDTSNDGVAQQIAAIVLTRRGERPMVPSYGIHDPAFIGLNVAEINAAIVLHGPYVTVTDIVSDLVDSGTRQRVVLSWRPQDGSR